MRHKNESSISQALKKQTDSENMMIIEDSFRYGGFRSVSSTKDDITSVSIFKKTNKYKNQINKSASNFLL